MSLQRTDDLLELIGNTPLVRVRSFDTGRCTLYLKLENLQRTLSHTEDARTQAAAVTKSLADRLGVLAEQMRTEQHLMVKIAENQASLQPVLTHLSDLLGRGAFGLDEQSRQHLRNLDHLAGRLIDEAAHGRAQTVSEIRSEIKLLARTIAALAESER